MSKKYSYVQVRNDVFTYDTTYICCILNHKLCLKTFQAKKSLKKRHLIKFNFRQTGQTAGTNTELGICFE